MVTSSTTQTYGLLMSAHRMVVAHAEIRNIRPPMVGVPFLVSRCDSGPSVRIGWPSRCLILSQLMMRGPISSVRKKANRMALPARNVW
jgi:hypothetical protein